MMCSAVVITSIKDLLRVKLIGAKTYDVIMIINDTQYDEEIVV